MKKFSIHSELELESTPTVQEKMLPCHGMPAFRSCGKLQILLSPDLRNWEYEEYENHPTRNFIVSEWGQDNIEARLQKMYEKQK